MIGFTIASGDVSPAFVQAQTVVSQEMQTSEHVIVEDPKPDQPPSFKLGQGFVPLEGGRILLRLVEAPTLEFDPVLRRYSLRGWGMSFDGAEIVNLPRMMARKFLKLFSLAKNNNLSATEKENWANILGEVDYAAFSSDRTPASYVEGRVIGRKPVVTVEWHDGERQTIPERIAPVLNILDENEDFGAFVKWGRGDLIKDIERIVFLSPQTLDTLGE